MNILNKIKKILHKNHKALADDNSSFINTTLISRCNFNTIILIQFSDDYLADACELVHTIHNCVFKSSSYEEDLDEYDIDGNRKFLLHNKNYILLSLNINNIKSILMDMNLSNKFINPIKEEIYENVLYDNELNIFEPYSVLENNKFKIKSDRDIINDDTVVIKQGEQYQSIIKVLQLLPDIFTGLDVSNVTYYSGKYSKDKYISIYKLGLDVILNANDSEKIDLAPLIVDIFNGIRRKRISTIDELSDVLATPLFLQEAEQEHGGMTDIEIDDIFKQQYERFTATVDYMQEYTEVDEEMPEGTIPDLDILEEDENDK